MTTTEKNKALVTRFNKEYIEQGSINVFDELVADDFINHTSAHGAPKDREGVPMFIIHTLRKGFPDITVEIHNQIAEGDKVTTLKSFHGTQTGEFLGIPATGKKVKIDVIDIITLRDGKYTEHWGMSNIPDVMQLLKG